MGSQRVGHDWATELNWTETCVIILSLIFTRYLTFGGVPLTCLSFTFLMKKMGNIVCTLLSKSDNKRLAQHLALFPPLLIKPDKLETQTHAHVVLNSKNSKTDRKGKKKSQTLYKKKSESKLKRWIWGTTAETQMYPPVGAGQGRRWETQGKAGICCPSPSTCLSNSSPLTSSQVLGIITESSRPWYFPSRIFPWEFML